MNLFDISFHGEVHQRGSYLMFSSISMRTFPKRLDFLHSKSKIQLITSCLYLTYVTLEASGTLIFQQSIVKHKFSVRNLKRLVFASLAALHTQHQDHSTNTSKRIFILYYFSLPPFSVFSKSFSFDTNNKMAGIFNWQPPLPLDNTDQIFSISFK